jgi:hypothetical protein
MPDVTRLTAARQLPIDRQSLALRLWDGNPTIPAVYVAVPHADGRPGYAVRKHVPEPTPVEAMLDRVRKVAEALA